MPRKGSRVAVTFNLQIGPYGSPPLATIFLDYKGESNMAYEYTKAKPITLRDAGNDEKWLQEVITRDPAILGFGDVVVIQRERPQPTRSNCMNSR